MFACKFDQSGESLGVADSDVCEHFAIETAFGFFQAVDQLAVRDVVVFRSSRDTSDPEFAEVAFLLTTIAERKVQCAAERFHRLAIDTSASSDKAFNAFQVTVAAAACFKTSFNPHLVPPCAQEGSGIRICDPSVQRDNVCLERRAATTTCLLLQRRE